MRRALITLEGMGLLSRKPGRGTIVRPVGEAPAGRQAPRRGGSTFEGAPVEFEGIHRAKYGPEWARPKRKWPLFGTGRLSSVERLLKRGGARTGIEEIAIPESLAPVLDEDAPLSLAEFLSAHGLEAAGMTETISADITSLPESVSLSCDRHTPLLVITRTAHDMNGAVIARQVMRLIADGLTYG